jgi:pimeloyl-ACP methyl ester carboxylesterase
MTVVLVHGNPETDVVWGPLVGHDWGGGHVANVAMTRPDLLRSWCSDVLGIFEPDYVWHDLAQVWQTPGAGEAAVEAVLAVLDGLGHWWMVQEPARGAVALTDFWSSLPA